MCVENETRRAKESESVEKRGGTLCWWFERGLGWWSRRHVFTGSFRDAGTRRDVGGQVPTGRLRGGSDWGQRCEGVVSDGRSRV